MKHETLFYSDAHYSTFPHVVRLGEQHLMVTFRIAGQKSVQAAKNEQVTHHESDSGIAVVESFDNGKSWDQDSFRIVYQGSMGVNDPALTVLKKGKILLRFAGLEVLLSKERSKLTSPLISSREEHGLVAGMLGNFVMSSDDDGSTWSEAQLIEVAGVTHSCSREPIVELSDGTLLLSVYQGAPHKTDEVWVIRSYDEGKTWGDPICMLSDPNGAHSQHYGVNYNETALLPLGNGKIVAMARADSSFFAAGDYIPVGGVGELIFSSSLDGGLSWFPGKKSGLWGQPAHLCRLGDGRLLCTYGYRKKPYGVRASISEDEGLTWSEPIIIREDENISWDVGYPSSVLLSDTSVLTIYYFQNNNKIRYIDSTTWML
jgi:sialidase-1